MAGLSRAAFTDARRLVVQADVVVVCVAALDVALVRPTARRLATVPVARGVGLLTVGDGRVRIVTAQRPPASVRAAPAGVRTTAGVRAAPGVVPARFAFSAALETVAWLSEPIIFALASFRPHVAGGFWPIGAGGQRVRTGGSGRAAGVHAAPGAHHDRSTCRDAHPAGVGRHRPTRTSSARRCGDSARRCSDSAR